MAPVSVINDLGEARDWFQGGASMVGSPDDKQQNHAHEQHRLLKLDKEAPNSSVDAVQTAAETMDKATRLTRGADSVAEQSTGKAAMNAEPPADAQSQASSARYQAAAAVGEAKAHGSRHSHSFADVSAAAKKEATSIAGAARKTREGTKSGGLQVAASQIVDSAFASLEQMHLSESGRKRQAAIPASAESAIERMVLAAKAESRKQQQQAAQQIRKMEDDASTELKKQVKDAAQHVDKEIASQVRHAEAEIEHKMAHQITDQIAATQAESMFQDAQMTVATQDKIAERVAAEPTKGEAVMVEKERRTTTKSETGDHGDIKAVTKDTTGVKRQKPRASIGHDDMEILFGPASSTTTRT